MSSAIERFEALLAQGQDSALLRFSLGNACLKAGRLDEAILHLERAVEHDSRYSAAWKLLGQARVQAGRTDAAAEAYRQGIAVAETRGDIQAAKEMKVFLRRLERD